MSINLSITGDLASGKSTLGHHLSETLGAKYISAGSILREKAAQRNMDILEMNVDANKDLVKSAWMDQEIDDAIKMAMDASTDAGDRYIVDARVGFFYAPDSLRIRLLTHPTISATRVFNAGRETEKYHSVEEAAIALQTRRGLERERFITRYDVDIDDFSNYDLVIDTSFLPAERTAEIVEKVIAVAEEGKPFPKYWCHPAQLIPSGQSCRSFNEGAAQALVEDMAAGKFDDFENTGKQGLIAEYTQDRDLLLYEGHHRATAAHVASKPYIGLDLMEDERDPRVRERLLSHMYDHYELIAYMSRKFVESHPDAPAPLWGRYGSETCDEILNSYKFDFVARFLKEQEAAPSSSPKAFGS